MILAEAPWESSFRAVERLFFEAQKWSDVCEGSLRPVGLGMGLVEIGFWRD